MNKEAVISQVRVMMQKIKYDLNDIEEYVIKKLEEVE